MSEESNVTSTPVDMTAGSDPVQGIVSENEVKDALAEKAAEEGSSAGAEAEPAAEKDEFASKFAALSRKEKDLRQKQQEIEAKYAEYEAWKKEQEEKANQKEPEVPLEYRLKKNPLDTLAEMGLSYEKLTELALNDGKPTTDMQMDLMRQELEQKYKSEIEALREEYLKDKEAQAEKEYEQTLNKFVNDLTDFVNTNEQYEFIKANDAVDLVYEVIQDHYNNTNEILSNKDAADLVESQLKEEFEKSFEKLGSKLGYTKAQQAREAAAQSPTLSNSQTSHVSTHGTKHLSEEESKAAAAQLIKWTD